MTVANGMQRRRPQGDLPSRNFDLNVPGPKGSSPRRITVGVGWKDGAVFEVFIRACPGDQRALANACARLISCWLQAGGSPENVIRALRGQASVWSPVPWCRGSGFVVSIADAVGRLLIELTPEAGESA